VTFEDVTGQAADEDPTGTASFDPDRPPEGVEEHHRDREPHPDRVNGAAAEEEQGVGRRESVVAEEPARTFATGCRKADVPHGPRAFIHERRHRVEP